MATFPENFYIHPAYTPADINAAARTGVRVDCRDVGLATFIGITNDVAAVVTYTFQEHTLIAAGTTQSLATITHYWEKSATTDALLLSEDFLDKQTQAAVATVATTTAHANVVAVPFAMDEMDIVDGFRWISVNTSAPGAACIAAGFWILGNMRYAQAEITVTMP